MASGPDEMLDCSDYPTRPTPTWRGLFQEAAHQRNELLAACEKLCEAIKEHGQSQCNRDYDGPSLEFIEENWQDSELPYLLDAYKEGMVAIAAVTNV